MRAFFDTTDAHPGRLATSPGLTRSAISKLVDRLLVKELVSVRSEPRDGRTQLLDLTAAGRRLVPELATLAAENDFEAFGHLGEKQRIQLQTLLRALAQHHGLRGRRWTDSPEQRRALVVRTLVGYTHRDDASTRACDATTSQHTQRENGRDGKSNLRTEPYAGRLCRS